MMEKRFGLLAAAALSLSVLIVGCAHRGATTMLNNTKELITENSGKALVLLVGHHTCPGTQKALAFCDDYNRRKPKDARLVYLEVPMLGKTGISAWSHPFPRVIDANRQAAAELDFFFYPTLYIFDRVGRTRYVGRCDEEKTPGMVEEILAEAPDAPAKIYTRPMPKPGESAPELTALDGNGRRVKLDSLLGKDGLLLVFSRLSCSGTRAALPRISELKTALSDNDIAVTIVSNDGDRAGYDTLCPGIPVVFDADGGTARAYNVEATPIFFLIGKDRAIRAQGPFTPEAVAAALSPSTKPAACPSGFG